MTCHYLRYESAIGELLLVEELGFVREIRFALDEGQHAVEADWNEGSGLLEEVRNQLNQYFSGERREFALPLRPEGTAFQRDVWKALSEVPFGETISYGELARRLGKQGASRAVGAANGNNPIPIVIPCHRVVGWDGRLTGFAGGIDLKRRLLEHEERSTAAQGMLFSTN